LPVVLFHLSHFILHPLSFYLYNVPLSEPSFQRVTIVGLGLVGGSWGLALRKSGFRGRRVGVDRAEVLERALASRAVDEGSTDFSAAVANADLVLLATPVGAILELLPLAASQTPPGALTTDVGSTKRVISERAREVFEDDQLFLGGHPLAGKERSGFEHADARLFEGSRYVLTPLAPDHMNDPRVGTFMRLIESVGARPITSDPASHDRAMGFLSHLPQLLETGLASLIAEQAGRDFIPPELAASGFRDATRLADSPFSVWRDICATNADNIQEALDLVIRKLESIKGNLKSQELEREFEAAQELRRLLADSE
jgi:prephenate dehydrogenase